MSATLNNSALRLGPSATLLALVAALAVGGCASGPSSTARKGAAKTEGEVVVSVQVQRDYNAALAMLEAGDVDGARAALDAIIAAQPTLVGPRVNLGIALTQQGEYALAEQALEAAIEQRPSAVEAWNQLGVVYRHMGRFLSARDAYGQALVLAPDYARAHFNAAVLHDLYLHEPARALEHYEKYRALALEPDERVEAWIADMRRQVQAEQQTAGIVDEEF